MGGRKQFLVVEQADRVVAEAEPVLHPFITSRRYCPFSQARRVDAEARQRDQVTGAGQLRHDRVVHHEQVGELVRGRLSQRLGCGVSGRENIALHGVPGVGLFELFDKCHHFGVVTGCVVILHGDDPWFGRRQHRCRRHPMRRRHSRHRPADGHQQHGRGRSSQRGTPLYSLNMHHFFVTSLLWFVDKICEDQVLWRRPVVNISARLFSPLCSIRLVTSRRPTIVWWVG